MGTYRKNLDKWQPYHTSLPGIEVINHNIMYVAVRQEAGLLDDLEMRSSHSVSST